MSFDINKHPMILIEHFKDKIGEGFSFEFSKYFYIPQSISDNRQTFLVHANRAFESIGQITSGLSENQDLAFHSKITTHKTKKIYHIPMIDLKKSRINSFDIKLISEALTFFKIRKGFLFTSGRSYHVYGDGLISNEEFSVFLGRSLLINQPILNDIVDTRWIGHRLMAGYCALRWTMNNSNYLAMPQLAGEI